MLVLHCIHRTSPAAIIIAWFNCSLIKYI